MFRITRTAFYRIVLLTISILCSGYLLLPLAYGIVFCIYYNLWSIKAPDKITNIHWMECVQIIPVIVMFACLLLATKLKLKNKRGAGIIFVSSILIYVASYGILSTFGTYRPTQSGNMRYSYGFGLSVTDIIIWQPKYVSCQIFRNVDGRHTIRGNIFGYFYLPLALVDQHYFHKTWHYFTQSF